MAVGLPDLPRFLVLNPLSTVRVEIRLATPACEIDVELDNPAPGRSFILLIGHKEGPFVQRVRLSGKARIFFEPRAPGDYVLLVANPQNLAITLRLKARDVGVVPVVTSRGTSRTRSKGKRTRYRLTAHRTVPARSRTSRSPPSRRP